MFKPLPKGWTSYALLCAVYVLITLLTNAHFLGDTVSDAKYLTEVNLRDFGHLLWKPLSLLTARALYPLTKQWVGPGGYLNLVWTMLALTWLLGLVSVCLVRALAAQVCQRAVTANLVALAFLLSQAFLNFTQTGLSYVPGLTLALAGTYLLVRASRASNPSWRQALAAGLALALSISCWVPYLWAVPAALLAPLLLDGITRDRLRLVAQTTLITGLAVGGIFGLAALSQGLYTVAGVRDWIASSSHGAANRGLPRAALGFARSFISLGNDGILFKRFLVRDPFNPVSLTDLLRVSLWQLGLFYLFIGALLLTLVRKPPGRRYLLYWLAGSLPVLIFGVLWQGGDMERYLPLYPALFLVLGYALEQGQRWFRAVALSFFVLAALANLWAMAKPRLAVREQATYARLAPLAARWRPQNSLVTISQQDEAWVFHMAYPFHPLNRHGLEVYHLIEPGTASVPRWSQLFAAKTLAVWQSGGEVWISQRVFSPRPQPHWNWVEGSDPRVTWPSLPAFFAAFEYSAPLGAPDGFQCLLPSDRNREQLSKLLQAETTVASGEPPTH